MKENKGRFTKERIAQRYKKGVTTDGGRHNGIVCAVDELVPVKSSTGKVYMHHKRTSYARYIMGKIPKGHIVYHKDGDYTNNEPDNLEIISRAELLKRNRRL